MILLFWLQVSHWYWLILPRLTTIAIGDVHNCLKFLLNCHPIYRFWSLETKVLSRIWDSIFDRLVCMYVEVVSFSFQVIFKANNEIRHLTFFTYNWILRLINLLVQELDTFFFSKFKIPTWKMLIICFNRKVCKLLPNNFTRIFFNLHINSLLCLLLTYFENIVKI